MNEVSIRVRIAGRFLERARGLLFSRPLPSGTALLLPHTAAVHGLLMTRALDLVFLSAGWRVLDVATLPPGRLRWRLGAVAVLEFEAGQAAALGIVPGTRIRPQAQAGPPLERAADTGAVASRLVAAWPLAWLAALLLTGLAVTTADPARASPSASAGGAELAQREPGTAQRASARGGQRGLPQAWQKRFAEQAEALYRSGSDQEALSAYAAWLDAEPAAEAHVILRVGNIHQRQGRDWLAIDSYRRALSLPGTEDPSLLDARRKALANLEGLLEAVSHQVADALVAGSEPASRAEYSEHSEGRVRRERLWAAPRPPDALPRSPAPQRATAIATSTAGPAALAPTAPRTRGGPSPSIEYLGGR